MLQHYWSLAIRLFSVIFREVGRWGGLTTLEKCSECILQTLGQDLMRLPVIQTPVKTHVRGDGENTCMQQNNNTHTGILNKYIHSILIKRLYLITISQNKRTCRPEDVVRVIWLESKCRRAKNKINTQS